MNLSKSTYCGVFALTVLFYVCLHPQLTMAQNATKDDQKVYTVIEVPPQFPGGLEAWEKYRQANLKYPATALKMRGDEQVFVNFTVTKVGHIADVQALDHPNKSYDPEMVKEAERLIKGMPKWTPAKVAGKNVACKYNMPVLFSTHN